MLQEDGSVYSFSLIKSPNLDWSVYCFKECSSNIANFLQHKILTEGYYTYLLTQFSLNVFSCAVTCVYKYVYTSTVRISNSIHDPKLCLMIARLCSPRPEWSSEAGCWWWLGPIDLCVLWIVMMWSLAGDRTLATGAGVSIVSILELETNLPEVLSFSIMGKFRPGLKSLLALSHLRIY